MVRTLAMVGCLTAAFAFGSAVAWAGEQKDRGKEEKEHDGEHKAAHGGCLNAIGTCENGHAEVKIEGNVLMLWFVGGGSDTDKAVRIPDKEISLSVTLDGEKEAKTLVLKAKPNELAEEKEGDCSHFEGQADWLKDAKKFAATGKVTFKGKKQDLRIEYPAGYDPDDDKEQAGEGHSGKDEEKADQK